MNRLLEVVHSKQKLYLVFEFLNQDLKKYMDSTPASGISMALVKVTEAQQSVANMNVYSGGRLLWEEGFICTINYL